MAAGKINLQKASGGITAITGVDGTGNTQLVLPESGTVATTAEVSSAVAPLATTAYVDGKMVLSTAVNTTSGTAIDFTGIPSWVKKITVMFEGVSTNGSSPVQIQLGDIEGIEISGYVTAMGQLNNVGGGGFYLPTSGFVLATTVSAAGVMSGMSVFANINANTWTANGNMFSRNDTICYMAGSKTLSGTLNRIRITTVNGTDVFDAGQINIMYEG